jgi:hypothetical protein
MFEADGIEFEKDEQGNDVFLHIDIKKQADLYHYILYSLNTQKEYSNGISEEAFLKERENYISGDALFGHLKDIIRSHPWKK